LLSLDVVDGLERRRSPRDAEAHILGDGTDPGEAAHVIAGIASADQRLEDRTAGECRHRRAVARRLFCEIVGRADAASTGHHLHRHGRFARDVAADVAAD
jgi:hypothetical protein